MSPKQLAKCCLYYKEEVLDVIVVINWSGLWGRSWLCWGLTGCRRWRLTSPSLWRRRLISLGFGFARYCCRRRRHWRVWSRWYSPHQRAGTAPLRFYLSLWQTCCSACSTCTIPVAKGERTGGRKGRATCCPQSRPPQGVQRCCCSAPAPDAQAWSGHREDPWDLLGTPAQRWQCLGRGVTLAGGSAAPNTALVPGGTPQRNLYLGQAKINPCISKNLLIELRNSLLCCFWKLSWDIWCSATNGFPE